MDGTDSIKVHASGFVLKHFSQEVFYFQVGSFAEKHAVGTTTNRAQGLLAAIHPAFALIEQSFLGCGKSFNKKQIGFKTLDFRAERNSAFEIAAVQGSKTRKEEPAILQKQPP